ncbi:MAG: DUF2127 domain-containing protein [Ignavibacteriaceae bacterium]
MKIFRKHLTEHRLYKLFKIGIALKAIDGVLETIGGVLLTANYIMNAIHHLSANTTIFAAIYLLIHGLIKIGLVAALWKNKLWAFPTAILFLFAFLSYQLYRFFISHSPALLILSITDVVIILLVWHEYNYIKEHGIKHLNQE